MRQGTGWILHNSIDSTTTLRCISCNERVVMESKDRSYEISISLTTAEQESISFFTGEYFATAEYLACSKKCFDSFRQQLIEAQPMIYCALCYDIKAYCDCNNCDCNNCNCNRNCENGNCICNCNNCNCKCNCNCNCKCDSQEEDTIDDYN